MSQQLATEDGGYIELFKLQKLFEARFALLPSIDPGYTADVPIEDAYRNDTVYATVLVRPSNPDFDHSWLNGDKGISMTLLLTRIIPAEDTRAIGGCYSIKQASDIDASSSAIDREVKLVIKKAILTFMGKYIDSLPYTVYECLKFVDRELCNIYEICGKAINRALGSSSVDGSSTSNQPSGGNAVNTTPNSDCNTEVDTWTLQEQKSLEFALGKTKGITNPAQRWAAVASIVKTKSAEECRRRFQRCRDQLRNKASEQKKALAEMPPEYQTVLARSDPLRLLDLELEKISVFNLLNFVAQLVCTRCTAVFDVGFSHGDKKTVVITRSCDNCHMAQRCEFQPVIAFGSQPTVGNLSLENCTFVDFISGEFFVTCESCDTQCKVRDVQNGTSKRSNCRGCFAKLALGFRGVEFGRDNTVETRVNKPVHVRPKVSRPKTPGVRGLKVGTPLPDNGSCKHYAKSFRWFRFPCCGKLFPCDVCHDEGSDHPYELANVIVCGHCSTQQPVSNKKCHNCNRGYSASTSAHWEGGKGCRDAVKLSKKDSKKYGLMRRQAEQAQSAARSTTSTGQTRHQRK
ncbi:CHY zinc finger [Babesia ovis]|uniref:CHY zinc finger n=1 Tax=Babesia ovis TaxID=5869 RepID=A0A9W5TCW8_BABOV|nr:CHY zinc finger [Babesia ovis]